MKLYKDMLWHQNPDPITAVRLQQDTVAMAAVWTKGVVVKELLDPDNDVWIVGINLMTAFGMERASEGDYIAMRKDGKFQIFRARVFESRFEEVGVVKAPAPRGLKPRR